MSNATSTRRLETRHTLVASGGLGRQVSLALRLASLPHVVELFGQRFMAFGTRVALHGNRAGFSKQDVTELSAMNSKPGSARAFARTVRDVIAWNGQRRTFFQRAHQIAELPPIAVFWGDRDAILPAAQGRTFAESVEGVVLKQFPGTGHYLHNEQPASFVLAVRAFLDDPAVHAARLRGKRVLSVGPEAGASLLRVG